MNHSVVCLDASKLVTFSLEFLVTVSRVFCTNIQNLDCRGSRYTENTQDRAVASLCLKGT